MNFREYITKSGKIVLAGKNAENNEELINQVRKDEYVLHTEKSGSPFVNIKTGLRGGKISKKDINEAAIFCAIYSHDWRDNKSNVKLHLFKGKDLYKNKGMKTGTFGVKNFKEINVKKEEIEKFEKR
jgi:predicted ribosome quality control (RQC) complex YloA/Tae2 family protein